MEPIRPGDTITAFTRIANLSQRNLSVGAAVFLIAETTYTNQLGQVVATQRATGIRY
jgi:acyl dehydratase